MSATPAQSPPPSGDEPPKGLTGDRGDPDGSAIPAFSAEAEALRLAIGIAPRNAELTKRLGALLLQLEDVTGALATYRRGMECGALSAHDVLGLVPEALRSPARLLLAAGLLEIAAAGLAADELEVARGVMRSLTKAGDLNES